MDMWRKNITENYEKTINKYNPPVREQQKLFPEYYSYNQTHNLVNA